MSLIGISTEKVVWVSCSVNTLSIKAAVLSVIHDGLNNYI